jgi:hypothetical protein
MLLRQQLIYITYKKNAVDDVCLSNVDLDRWIESDVLYSRPPPPLQLSLTREHVYAAAGRTSSIIARPLPILDSADPFRRTSCHRAPNEPAPPMPRAPRHGSVRQMVQRKQILLSMIYFVCINFKYWITIYV